MTRIMIGSKVKHDFSGNIGTVLAYRRDPQKYNYQDEGRTLKVFVNDKETNQ